MGSFDSKYNRLYGAIFGTFVLVFVVAYYPFYNNILQNTSPLNHQKVKCIILFVRNQLLGRAHRHTRAGTRKYNCDVPANCRQSGMCS